MRATAQSRFAQRQSCSLRWPLAPMQAPPSRPSRADDLGHREMAIRRDHLRLPAGHRRQAELSGRTPGGPSINVDASTLLDHLKMTFMGAFDAHNGRWGMFTDVLYLDVGGSKSKTRDFNIGHDRASRRAQRRT